MMKLAVLVLSLFLALSLNRAKASTSTPEPGFHKPSASSIQTPTKSVRVLAAKKAQRRLLAINDLDDSNNEPPGADELDLQQSYRRPRVVDELTLEADDDVSDYVAVRLAIARAKAMEVYRQKWQKTTDFS